MPTLSRHNEKILSFWHIHHPLYINAYPLLGHEGKVQHRANI